MQTVFDLQAAFQIAMALVAGLGGWFIKALFGRIDKLEQADAAIAQSVGELRVDLPTNYVGKGDFRKMGDDIFATLRRIEDKLDSKADK